MLSSKSRAWLRKTKVKYKAQEGLQVPYVDPNENYMDYYSVNAPANIEQNLAPDYATAQQRATKGIFDFEEGKVQVRNNQQSNRTDIPALTGFGNYTDAQGNIQQRKDTYEVSEAIGNMDIPFLSNWTKSVVGAYDFYESFKDKKNQEAFEKNYKEDLKERKEQARANNFYMTPYTLGRSDRLKHGGKVKYQSGGGVSNQIDLFMDYYNAQQDASKRSLDTLQQTYEERNNRLENEWKNRQIQGFAQWQGAGAASFGEYMSTFGGGMGGGMAAQKGGTITAFDYDKEAKIKAYRLKNPTWRVDSANLYKIEHKTKPGFQSSGKSKSRDRYREHQEGGEIDTDTESLYSENFISPYEQDVQQTQELETKLNTDNPGLSFEGKDSLLKWLMEDEPLETHTTNDIYFKVYGQEESNQTELPVKPLIDQFNSIGIKVGSINTGQHNPGSKHFSGKAFDIPGSKNGGREGLYKIYNYLNSSEGKRQFPNIKVINEIDAPAGKIGTANHLHIELID